MSLLDHALELASKGFHVFPLIPNSKLPAIRNFPELATNEPEKILHWWKTNPNYNIGISTTRYGKDESLAVIDVDNKNGKKGDDELLQLELSGCELPRTAEQLTPTGGRHLIFKNQQPIKQGANVLGHGLDIRARGGYIVGAGSRTDLGVYSYRDYPIEATPEWVIQRCGVSRRRAIPNPTASKDVDDSRAIARAKAFLEQDAPLAIEGDAGDQTTYRVACRVKDFGVSLPDAIALMSEHWNVNCVPPWHPEELARKIENAYRYGNEPVGVAAPETQFTKIPTEENEHPFTKLNKEFAFVIAGGGSHILWETVDHRDFFKLEHLTLQAFHQKFASETLAFGEDVKPLSQLWMRSPERRSYDGICFMPGLDSPKRFYNLWRGFTVEPADLAVNHSPTAQRSLEMFLEHAKENVCHGDQKLFNWLIGYFAHLVQRPWEKPLTALVFRGRKGVGKNALIDRVGFLLGNHYLLTSNRRYLVGNFNGHLENCLLFALDEAFWSGDKQAEGTLKDLITGKTHVIEHKGKEPYSVENCTRVCIIGNEEWLVPASHDERRFAVFDVGDGRKQDRHFFQSMREGMERGGYRLLLRFLLDYDLSTIDVNDAPRTAALLEQKVNSLDPFYQWWLECLTAGYVVCGDFSGGWPNEVDKEHFRSAFRRYVKERQIRSRIPDDRSLGRSLKSCLPSVDPTGKRREDGVIVNLYRFPSLEQARKEWSRFIGHPVAWE